MNPRLKKIIFQKLNKDLGKSEIILAENQSIWFIDRANKFWYFELEKSGKLWWRYEFFTDFFIIFSLETNEFQPLLSEWVEGVLNRGVVTTGNSSLPYSTSMEGVLNRGVVTTRKWYYGQCEAVEGVLNPGVVTTGGMCGTGQTKVEGVLNREVVTTVEVGNAWSGVTEGVLSHGYRKGSRKVEEVLNRKIETTEGSELFDNGAMERILEKKVVSISYASEKINFTQQVLVNELISNLPRAYGTENPSGYVVESATPLDTPAYDSVDEVLRYKVTRAIPDLNDSMVDVERLLDSNQ